MIIRVLMVYLLIVINNGCYHIELMYQIMVNVYIYGASYNISKFWPFLNSIFKVTYLIDIGYEGY